MPGPSEHSPVSLRDLVQRILMAANTDASPALSVAAALVQAERDGQKGHGLSRVASYAAQSRSGKVNGRAVPQLVELHPLRKASLLIDAAHGFAYPAIDMALELMKGPAIRETGVIAAGIVNSHHCGVAGHHVEALADAGYIGLLFANTPHAMAPWGGSTTLFGTNPIAFAAPRGGGEAAVVIDMALSNVARGKIVTAAQKGEAIPMGWAVDKHGNPTTDAKSALDGSLLPAGGAKGSALALMVEILAGVLVGPNLSRDATSFFEATGKPPSVGQLIVAIDPDAFCGSALFLERIELLVAAMDQSGARLPGARRLAQRKAATLSVDAKLMAELQAMPQA